MRVAFVQTEIAQVWLAQESISNTVGIEFWCRRLQFLCKLLPYNTFIFYSYNYIYFIELHVGSLLT